MKYEKWKSQIDITASLIEVLYGEPTEAGEVDRRIKETIQAERRYHHDRRARKEPALQQG